MSEEARKPSDELEARRRDERERKADEVMAFLGAEPVPDDYQPGAGERADAIPENALTAALDAYDRFGDVESQSDHAAAMTVALAAALRAVQPEAGNEEAEQLRQERDELLRGDALSWYQRVTSERDEARAEVARLRAAHPEADRAPESCTCRSSTYGHTPDCAMYGDVEYKP